VLIRFSLLLPALLFLSSLLSFLLSLPPWQLAFIVGHFDMIEARTAPGPEGTLIRCFATPGKGEQNRFALDLAVKLIPYYNDWFDTPYPLKKLDMCAIPDFSAGAMENCQRREKETGETRKSGREENMAHWQITHRQ
jgi:hypothetical protein